MLTWKDHLSVDQVSVRLNKNVTLIRLKPLNSQLRKKKLTNDFQARWEILTGSFGLQKISILAINNAFEIFDRWVRMVIPIARLCLIWSMGWKINCPSLKKKKKKKNYGVFSKTKLRTSPTVIVPEKLELKSIPAGQISLTPLFNRIGIGLLTWLSLHIRSLGEMLYEIFFHLS